LGVPAKAVAPLALSRAIIFCLFMTCSGARPFSLATIGESEPIRAKVANTFLFLHLPATCPWFLPKICHCEPCRIHGAAIYLPVLHLPQAPCHCEPCRIHGAAICLPVLYLPQALVIAKPKCEPGTNHTCGMVETIPLQAALVFGLLRYARNDKKQDGRVVLKDSSP